MGYNINDLFAYRFYGKGTDPTDTISNLGEGELADMIYRNKSQEEIKELISYRKAKENMMYKMFLRKGGKPKIKYPLYFAIFDKMPDEHSIKDRHPNSDMIRIPVNKFDYNTISFTYGLSYYALQRKDNHPTRRKLYMLDEINDIINEYGLIPYNQYTDDHMFVELQVWETDILKLV